LKPDRDDRGELCQAKFRDQLIAAPLKPRAAGTRTTSPSRIPRSIDRGPIEADVNDVWSAGEIEFRDQLIAAPLKRRNLFPALGAQHNSAIN